MGTRNISFSSEEFKGYIPPSPPNKPPPGIPLAAVSSYAVNDTPLEIPLESEYLPEHTYLAPRVAGYNTDDDIEKCKRENVYDALGKYRDSGEAMKKTNLFYETHDLKKQKPAKRCTIKGSDRPKSKRNGCCMTFFMVVIGFLALGAFVVTLLQFFGMLKCGQNTVNVASNTGSQTDPASAVVAATQNPEVTLKLLLLQSNITSLQMKMIPQQMELERLRNLTDLYQQQIKTLQNQLTAEEDKSKKLNTSMKELERLQAELKSSTTLVNETLSHDVIYLQKQIKDQQLKVESLNVSSDITNLNSKIDMEAIYRKSNDSMVKSELRGETRINGELIANLTKSLASLDTKTQNDIKNTQTQFSALVNQSEARSQNSDQSIVKSLALLNVSLSTQISNISLTPGPQGPVGKSGAGDLSACYSETKTVSIGSGRAGVVVKTMPLNFDPNAVVVTGAYCYANNVVKYQYIRFSTYHQCSCEATNSNAYSCSIVAWYCPKTS